MDRDTLLNMSDEELLHHCRTDHFISTGNGGQKRNKTSSAVRLTLKDSPISASASDDRQQSVNKTHALRKLRIAIALEMRQEPEPWQGQLNMNSKNQHYANFVACLVDQLFSNTWQVSETAKSFEISTGQLIKIIAKDDTLWQFVNRERQKAGYKVLKK
ncbi:MAG: peptide chain release factor-like protein [Lentisphaeraceae bacterium]|nr:peptide chain release factor-like protein [Lentisphaeraceae bacterium]